MKHTNPLPIGAVSVICISLEDRALDILSRRVVLVCDVTRDNPQLKFPGGRPNPGEELIAAAKRELFEETGLTLIGEPDVIFDQKRSDHAVRFYIGEADFQAAKEHGDENGRRLEVHTKNTLGDVLTRKIPILTPHFSALSSFTGCNATP